MKNAKKLMRRHKKMLSDEGLDPNLFYVCKDTPTLAVFVDKQGNKLEVLKGGEVSGRTT